MADVYVNALTTISTEPTTTDSLVAVNRNTNEGKIIDYNKLADAILNKLTSKQYSGLNTTSKLLVGAINELDSDVSSLNSSIGNLKVDIQTNVQSINFLPPENTLQCYRMASSSNITVTNAPTDFSASILANSIYISLPMPSQSLRIQMIGTQNGTLYMRCGVGSAGNNFTRII